jgi:hypothetical protein
MRNVAGSVGFASSFETETMSLEVPYSGEVHARHDGGLPTQREQKQLRRIALTLH